MEEAKAPHVTHELRHVANGEAPIIFCSICGKWAANNDHSKLAAPCEPIKRGTRHNLRLLQFGIVPKKGAKLPSNVKERAGRKKQ